MKKGIIYLLTLLFVLAMAPTGAFSIESTIMRYPVELAPSNDISLPGGPLRDPAGPDDIFYDDGNFNQSLIYIGNNLLGRVIFTPVNNFRLQAIRLAPANGRNVQNVNTNVWVYRHDGQNNLTDRVVFRQFVVPNGAEYMTIELAENDYVNFRAQEKFSIIYGPLPGGNPNQGAQGPWIQTDQATRTNTSYLGILVNNNPPLTHAGWTSNTGIAVDTDLFIRANGTIERFTDIQVNEIFNGNPNQIPSGAYHMLPGTPQRFKAELGNLGEAVQIGILNWEVFNADSERVFLYEQVIRQVPAQDTIFVECDSLWSTQTVGRYWVKATIMAENDVNLDNDVAYLDQFVIDPDNQDGEWISYTSGVATHRDASNMAALGVVYYAPPGDFSYNLTGFRFAVVSDSVVAQIPVQVWRCNVPPTGLVPWFTDTLETRATRDIQVLEVAFEGESQMIIGPDSAAFIVAFNTANSGILRDNIPPSAGSNRFMPRAMYISWDDGVRFGPAGSGDYMIDARIAVSDELPPGRRFIIVPDTLDFGWGLTQNEDHVMEAMFISTRRDEVNIRGITISPSAQQYFTVEPRQFNIAAGDTQIVRVTFRAPQLITMSTSFLVANNSDDAPQKLWRIFASTEVNSVSENVKPGIPSEWSLSQNYPNPFNPSTSIDFAMVKPGKASLAIYDMSGRMVKEVFNGEFNAGYHSLELDASDLPAGVYMYRLNAADFSSTRKMVLMK